jgi:putative PIN family toxin of toxin-antitoxin system
MRVVLDTNTLVSALLFSGTASRLLPLWQSHRITPLVSRSIVKEYFRVLAYPKFRLSAPEIRGLLDEELLPFVGTVKEPRRLSVVCRDPDDKKFIECAVVGRARDLITGDKNLRDLRAYRGVAIHNVGEFLETVRL